MSAANSQTEHEYNVRRWMTFVPRFPGETDVAYFARLLEAIGLEVEYPPQ